jgi:hypothetical protein
LNEGEAAASHLVKKPVVQQDADKQLTAFATVMHDLTEGQTLEAQEARR